MKFIVSMTEQEAQNALADSALTTLGLDPCWWTVSVDLRCFGVDIDLTITPKEPAQDAPQVPIQESPK